MLNNWRYGGFATRHRGTCPQGTLAQGRVENNEIVTAWSFGFDLQRLALEAKIRAPHKSKTRQRLVPGHRVDDRRDSEGRQQMRGQQPGLGRRRFEPASHNHHHHGGAEEDDGGKWWRVLKTVNYIKKKSSFLKVYRRRIGVWIVFKSWSLNYMVCSALTLSDRPQPWPLCYCRLINNTRKYVEVTICSIRKLCVTSLLYMLLVLS